MTTHDRLVQIRTDGKHCAPLCQCLLKIPDGGSSCYVCGVGDVILDVVPPEPGTRVPTFNRTDECLALTEEEPT